jgi:hypothetical protein
VHLRGENRGCKTRDQRFDSEKPADLSCVCFVELTVAIRDFFATFRSTNSVGREEQRTFSIGFEYVMQHAPGKSLSACCSLSVMLEQIKL